MENLSTDQQGLRSKNSVLLKYCTRCLMPSTRPRIVFNDEGVCNACAWAEMKKSIDWVPRLRQLEDFCNSHRKSEGNYDCIVPVSGGKDSSYVAYKMKHELKMHPLCVNIAPPIPFEVGEENLRNFNNAGYDLMSVSPDPKIRAGISKKGLIEFGQPHLGWMINLHVVILKLASKLGIPFIMYGEEGETEYGGTTKLRDTATYDIEDSIRLYLSGINPEQFRDKYTPKEYYWWTYPTEKEFRDSGIVLAHWSYFEDWDPYQHYLVAKEKCGLKEKPKASVGTYNNFAQTDTPIHDLHTYLMYMKFGFGRCTADVCIDIRRGAMSRKQGLELVRRLDGTYPEPYIPLYLDYYKMTQSEFDAVIDKWANKNLFEKVNGRWQPIFEVH